MVKGKMFNEIQAYKQIGYTIRKRVEAHKRQIYQGSPAL